MTVNLNNTAPMQSHFGVYALIVDKTKKSVLLIKKTLGCYTGLYDLPGGAMEPHELLEDALHREVLEETDCTITEAEQLGAFSAKFPFLHAEGHNVTLRHIGAVYLADISGTPRAHATGLDDSGGCVWVPFAEISNNNAAPFVVDSIKAYLKKHGG